MATGEIQITKGTGWQALTGAAGNIILQNKSNVSTVQYFIGASAPTAEQGVDLPPLNEHTPSIQATETAYARCINSDAFLAWSE